jgi:hypothetical protein
MPAPSEAISPARWGLIIAAMLGSTLLLCLALPSLPSSRPILALFPAALLGKNPIVLAAASGAKILGAGPVAGSVFVIADTPSAHARIAASALLIPGSGYRGCNNK